MDGTESPDDLDRCVIFDALFRKHALYPQELAEKTGLNRKHIAHITKGHEWFVTIDGEIRINYANSKHPALK